MEESDYSIGNDEHDFVEFQRAGASVNGEFECSCCGYGVTIRRELPRCPMCGEELWERSQRNPFRTALIGLHSRLE